MNTAVIYHPPDRPAPGGDPAALDRLAADAALLAARRRTVPGAAQSRSFVAPA